MAKMTGKMTAITTVQPLKIKNSKKRTRTFILTAIIRLYLITNMTKTVSTTVWWTLMKNDSKMEEKT